MYWVVGGAESAGCGSQVQAKQMEKPGVGMVSEMGFHPYQEPETEAESWEAPLGVSLREEEKGGGFHDFPSAQSPRKPGSRSSGHLLQTSPVLVGVPKPILLGLEGSVGLGWWV